MITLTAGLIDQLRTPAGGYNKASMEIIGAWPLVVGWKDRLVGTRIADRKWKAALKAKDKERHIYRGNTRR